MSVWDLYEKAAEAFDSAIKAQVSVVLWILVAAYLSFLLGSTRIMIVAVLVDLSVRCVLGKLLKRIR